MFTLFDFFRLIGAVVGAVFGGYYGYEKYGLLAAIVGTVLGYILGIIAGGLPLLTGLLWIRCNLKLCSTPKLKLRLHSEYFIAHLLIRELILRGERLEEFRDYVVELLSSENTDKQYFGKGLAQIWFPDLLSDTSSVFFRPQSSRQ